MSNWRLREAARCVAQGGVIAYPTEAVYGLGCDPLNWFAVERILALKNRPVEKGLILIAADFQQLLPYVVPLSEQEMQPLNDSWPGPNTWLLPAHPDSPPWLKGRHEALAVRVTAHPLAAALCRACNSPLVSTSANQSGQPPARSALQVHTRLPGGVDLILAGEVGAERNCSTIRDAVNGRTIRA